MIQIFVGMDRREVVCHHVFCNSVARRSSRLVGFVPVGGLDIGRRDGATDFAYSRFLIPQLCDYRGWAIFADGDMLCKADIAELWDLRDNRCAVIVVKHDYTSRAPVKMDGVPNRNYPRKNWSSLALWNCAHPLNRGLTTRYVTAAKGADLHRFAWITDDEYIGSLPTTWNWLVGEYPRNDGAKLLHYTLGAPCFKDYEDCDHAAEWHEERRMTFHAEEACKQAA